MSCLNRFGLLILSVIVVTVGIAYAAPATHLRLDSVRFYEPDGNTRFEIPISVFRSRLYYRNDSSGSRFTSYRLRLRVYRDTALIASDIWDRVHHPSGTEGTAKGVLPDLASASLPPGTYRLELEMTDSAKHFLDRRVFDSLRIEHQPKRLNLSGLLLCSEIERDTGTDEFHRNGYRVIPYAEKMYGVNQPVLFLYWEQYGQNPDTLCRYNITISASRSLKPVKPVLKREKQVSSDRSFNVEAIPVNDLPTGTYLVQINAVLFPSGSSDSCFTRFFVYSDTMPTTALRPDSIEPIRNSNIVPLHDMHYIIDPPTLEIVSKLPLEQQRTWVEHYWKEHDPTPNTPTNETMEQYRTRLKEVAKFATGRKEGWQTDRGRVYLLYGPPDDIEDNAFQTSQFNENPTSPTSNRPFVVWRYNSIAGGVYFVFGDVDLFGDYELLHSTMTGEIHNENWFRRLKGIK